MLTRGAAAEVVAGHQHRAVGVLRAVQDEVGIAAPALEEELAPASPLDPLQVDGRDDLVGVDVGAVERHDLAGVRRKLVHGPYPSIFQSRMSTKWPAIAAAAAIAGLTRWVRPPRPCRPSKFRLEVEAQRSPGWRMSGFMPRHIEQPASRHSKPASRNTLSSPSCSASALTCCEPGTTSAVTLGLTVRPRITLAAACRSSIREFVHDPMNTRSRP